MYFYKLTVKVFLIYIGIKFIIQIKYVLFTKGLLYFINILCSNVERVFHQLLFITLNLYEYLSTYKEFWISLSYVAFVNFLHK